MSRIRPMRWDYPPVTPSQSTGRWNKHYAEIPATKHFRGLDEHPKATTRLRIFRCVKCQVSVVDDPRDSKAPGRPHMVRSLGADMSEVRSAAGCVVAFALVAVMSALAWVLFVAAAVRVAYALGWLP